MLHELTSNKPRQAHSMYDDTATVLFSEMVIVSAIIQLAINYLTHILLNLNRSSHVNARNVVILPCVCVQGDALTSHLCVTRVTFRCLFKQRHLSARWRNTPADLFI